jgi:HlyD family secretion protein
MSKKLLNKIILVAAVAVSAFIGYKVWQGQRFALPKGIASGNGRVESKLVDVATKEALKVKEILVKEGDLVEPNQVLVRLTRYVESELVEQGKGRTRQDRDRPHCQAPGENASVRN